MSRPVRLLFWLLIAAAPGVAGAAGGPVRAQLDTVGFAVTAADFESALTAALTAEELPPAFAATGAAAAVAAIVPHDDYLYAGRTAVHVLPHLQAPRWVVLGVCHACRRLGVRDQLLLDDFERWSVAGREFPVAVALRERLRHDLGEDAVVARERHEQEHSIEALLPWLGAAVAAPTFVPILVAGMEPDRLTALAERLAAVLAAVCRENGWQPGRDLGLLISADAVHYGCEGWGSGGYAPFGCAEAGHASGRAQDLELARETLAGPLEAARVAAFIDRVWDRDSPDYPAQPYRITWCGLYSIPFGLTAALALQRDLGLPEPAGTLLRYGDSVSDGRLTAASEHLGVTAPNTLAHWVGYPALIYTLSRVP